MSLALATKGIISNRGSGGTFPETLASAVWEFLKATPVVLNSAWYHLVNSGGGGATPAEIWQYTGAGGRTLTYAYYDAYGL